MHNQATFIFWDNMNQLSKYIMPCILTSFFLLPAHASIYSSDMEAKNHPAQTTSWYYSDGLPVQENVGKLTVDYTNNPFKELCSNGFVLTFDGVSDFWQTESPVLGKQIKTAVVTLFCVTHKNSTKSFVTQDIIESESDDLFNLKYTITNFDLSPSTSGNNKAPSLVSKDSIFTFNNKGSGSDEDLFSRFTVFEFSEHVNSYIYELKKSLEDGIYSKKNKITASSTWDAIKTAK